jgi:hypothetical protein
MTHVTSASRLLRRAAAQPFYLAALLLALAAIPFAALLQYVGDPLHALGERIEGND